MFVTDYYADQLLDQLHYFARTYKYYRSLNIELKGYSFMESDI